jgi:hypothetical protein
MSKERLKEESPDGSQIPKHNSCVKILSKENLKKIQKLLQFLKKCAIITTQSVMLSMCTGGNTYEV